MSGHTGSGNSHEPTDAKATPVIVFIIVLAAFTACVA